MATRISQVLVTHRSSGLAARAVASFRQEAEGLGLDPEVVIVDHSEDRSERERLSRLEPSTLLDPPNRGYAAGLNAGRKVASGDLLVLSNPDLELDPGALGPMIDALGEGFGVVGPQFYLEGVLFPPAEVQTPLAEWRRRRARRSRRRAEALLARQATRWLGVWQARSPVAVDTLSGALLVTPAETFDRVGPWDEGYFLYFEETDWLRRAVARGVRPGLVPRARVRHAWGHSTEGHGETFRRSRERYYRKHFGRWCGEALVARRPAPATAWAAEIPSFAAGDPAAGEATVWLLSPFPTGLPAGGLLAPRRSLGAEIDAFRRSRGDSGALYLFAFEPDERRIAGSWRVG